MKERTFLSENWPCSNRGTSTDTKTKSATPCHDITLHLEMEGLTSLEATPTFALNLSDTSWYIILLPFLAFASRKQHKAMAALSTVQLRESVWPRPDPQNQVQWHRGRSPSRLPETEFQCLTVRSARPFRSVSEPHMTKAKDVPCDSLAVTPRRSARPSADPKHEVISRPTQTAEIPETPHPSANRVSGYSGHPIFPFSQVKMQERVHTRPTAPRGKSSGQPATGQLFLPNLSKDWRQALEENSCSGWVNRWLQPSQLWGVVHQILRWNQQKALKAMHRSTKKGRIPLQFVHCDRH